MLISIWLISMLPPIYFIGKSFLDSLHDFFFSSAALISGGDFNCYDKALDKFGGNFSVLFCSPS